MTLNSLCRRKYLRILITIIISVGMTGYLTLHSGSQSLIWIYPGVAKEIGHDSKLSIPSKLKLLSVTNHSEVQTANNLSSFNESAEVTKGKCFERIAFNYCNSFFHRVCSLQTIKSQRATFGHILQMLKTPDICLLAQKSVKKCNIGALQYLFCIFEYITTEPVCGPLSANFSNVKFIKI